MVANTLSAKEFIKQSKIYEDVSWVGTTTGFFFVYNSDEKKIRNQLDGILTGVIDLYEIDTGQNSILVVVFNGRQQQEFFLDEVGPFNIGQAKSITQADWLAKKERAKKFLTRKK